MKKYLRKFLGLTITTLPLIALVACAEKEIKPNEWYFDLKKIRFTHSTKFKEHLVAVLAGKKDNTEINPLDIGYPKPKFTSGFTAKYILNKVFNKASKVIELKVIIEKNGKFQSKIINVIPLIFTMDHAIDEYKNVSSISTKTKRTLHNELKDLKKGGPIDIRRLGYSEPTQLELKHFTKSYTINTINLKRADFVIKIDLILERNQKKSKKQTIEIFPKKIDFSVIKNKFRPLNSNKTQEEIKKALEEKKKKTTNASGYLIVSPELLGFTSPSGEELNGFGIEYVVDEKQIKFLNGNPTATIDFEVRFTKEWDKDTKKVTLTPKKQTKVKDKNSEINRILKKFKNIKIHSKTKAEIKATKYDIGIVENVKDPKTGKISKKPIIAAQTIPAGESLTTVHLGVLGYKPPDVTKTKDFDIKYFLMFGVEHPWHPRNEDAFKIQVKIIKKVKVLGSKEIKITYKPVEKKTM